MTMAPQTRRTFPIIAAFSGFALAAALTAFAAQPPEVEDPKAKPPAKKVGVEEEDPRGTVKKKVVVDDPDIVPGAGGKTPDARLDEIAKGAEQAANPAVKALLGKYVVPFDRFTDTKGGSVRIRPIPVFRGHLPGKFGIEELDASNRPKPSRLVTLTETRRIEFFEELAHAEVERWLKQKPVGSAPGPADLTADDQLAAAETLLAGAVRFHDYARGHPYPGREVPIRSGKGWDEVRKPLADRLLEVRVQQLQRAVAVSDWQRSRQLGTRLMAEYPKDATVAKAVAEARVAEAELLMKTNTHADRVKARELLDEFESRFPGGGGDQLRRLRKELTAEANRHLDMAKSYQKAGNLADARDALDRAEALDPTLPGLQDLRRALGGGYKVLYVGARVLPERMSPATARFDSEKQAVELLFEGLLEEIPDGTGGVRYRTGAALALPTVIPGGRELLIRQIPRRANGLDGFDAHDVVETVKLLRGRPDLPAAAGLAWLDDLPAPTGGGSLRLTFKHGHPDPRALLTFEVLPGRWLAERGKTADDPEFAARPFGTGPYRLHSVPEPGASGPREVVFVDNPAYGRSRERAGLPHIREIRFVETARLSDPFDDFRRGRLHILPDLTPAELTRALSQGGMELGGKGRVVTASTNRRVYILALNHRRVPIQNRDLRKGLSLAIDREAVLNDLFREVGAQHRRFTAPMTGPFPPSSWATPKGPGGVSVPLMNLGEAVVRLRRYLASPGAVPELRLAFPAGDAQAQAACEKIKAQVEALFKDATDGRKLTLTLEAVEPRDLLGRVQDQHRYDLAYLPFDYPDDWYPFGLAAFLDPTAADRGGRNYTGFLAPGTNAGEEEQTLKGELAGLLEHRDFAGEITGRTKRVHELCNETMPFVPLWQLDRHMLVSTGLKVFVDDSPSPSPVQVLNPTVLFSNVARWRLD